MAEKFWNAVALLAGLAGIVFFASIAVWIIPILTAVTVFTVALLIVVGLLKWAAQALFGKGPSQ